MINTMNCILSPEVSGLLPAVLIDYLWNLANEVQAPYSQVFILTKGLLGGRELQEIQHICGEQLIGSHKVFGFEPVNATVLVDKQNGETRMKAVGLLEALGFGPALI